MRLSHKRYPNVQVLFHQQFPNEIYIGPKSKPEIAYKSIAMAVEDKIDIVDKKSKKDKKSKDKSEKKEKRHSEAGGISKEKKDKKKDKAKQDKLAHALDAHLKSEATDATALVVADKPKNIDVDVEDIIKPTEELVPFALPIADDKTHKKLYKIVKKGKSLSASARANWVAISLPIAR